MPKRKKVEPADVLAPGAMVTVTLPALDAVLAYACWENGADGIQNRIESASGYAALVRVLEQLRAAAGVDGRSPEFHRLLKEHGFRV